MATEVQVVKSFEEKMMDKLRESAGELFSQEELKKIVEKGIDKLFFEPRIASSNYGRTEYKNSLGEELVSKFMKEQVQIAVGNWIKENPEKILELINKAMRDGVTKMVLNSFDQIFQSSLMVFTESIKQQIQNMPKY